MVEFSTTEVDAHRAARGLEKCPVCNYSLRTLPIAHRCPECGFAFDEHTEVWRPRSFRRYWASTGGLVLLCQLPNMLNTARRGPRSFFFWIAMAYVALTAIMIWIVIRSFRLGPFIAITPTGVRLRDRFGVKDYPWERIKTSPKWPGGVGIAHAKRGNYCIPTGHLTGSKEAEAGFHQRLAAGRERWLARAKPEGLPQEGVASPAVE